jgi:hypothetical protein
VFFWLHCSEEHVGVWVAGDDAGAVLPRRRRRRRIRVLQVQAQEVHGFRGDGDHVAVHASRGPERREAAAERGGPG